MSSLGTVPGARKIDMSTRAATHPLRHIDFALVGATLVLLALGAVMVYSASSTRLEVQGIDSQFFLKRQLVGITLGVAAMILIMLFDYRRYRGWAPVLYVGGIVLLIGVLTPLGSEVNGARGWYNLPGFQIQPSEIVKPILIILLSSVAARDDGALTLRRMGEVLLLAAVPMALIVLQPDIGTAMVYVAIVFAILLIAGIKLRYIAALVVIGLVLIVGAFQFDVIEDYQKTRLTSFLDPASDPRASGYNLRQSQIAIGSGGLVGKGLFEGTQTNLSYVPEQHTDFIFTAIGEELGYVGAMFVLVLYAVIVWRGVRIAMMSRDFFGTLVAAGAVTALCAQAFLNVGVTLGVMPVTGVTLPLVSYGVGSVITTCLLIGLLVNVHMRRMTTGPKGADLMRPVL